MSNTLSYKELSRPFVFKNNLLCHTIKRMKPTFTEGEFILSVLPSSFKVNSTLSSFPPSVLYMLATSMTCCVLVDGTTLRGDYKTPWDYLQELLTHLGANLAAKEHKPQRLVTDHLYTYNFLIDFCQKSDIELLMTKELKYAHYFISVALFEEGASDAVVEALGGELIADEDYFETPEEFFMIYYPKFIKSEYAKAFKSWQLTQASPYIETLNYMMWNDQNEIPYEWSGDS